MQEYDIALKLLLQGSAKHTVRELTGGPVEKWLDIELPKVQNTRMDLLGEIAGGELVHLELQSGDEAAMPHGRVLPGSVSALREIPPPGTALRGRSTPAHG
jgi:hypothetical protein